MIGLDAGGSAKGMEASERTEVTDGSGWETGASGLLPSGVLLYVSVCPNVHVGKLAHPCS
jgi:hypothetical protein